MWCYESCAGRRWFSDRDYAETWCKMCGYNTRDLTFDDDTPKLKRVHGSVYEESI